MEKSEMVSQIKKLLDEEKLVIGTNVALKELKKGGLSKVFLSSNIPKNVRDDIEYYSKMAEVEIVETGLSNEEFGIVCKKSFLISVAGQKK